VKLSSLENLGAFALLGPGFGRGQWLLLTDLVETDGTPQFIYAPFEISGRAPLLFTSLSIVAIELEFDAAPRPVVACLKDEGYREIVECIRSAIALGDVYQVCYTVRAEIGATTGAEILSLMCGRGTPRFAAWVRLPNGEEFVSGSPELFFETTGRQIHAEPMKGTADRNSGGVLEASDKDRAELAMITDLLRNDLTPVCRPQSVRVECERRVIELPYALQTVSDIVGVMADDMTPLNALAALHPGGSVTGAPKQAALAMIQGLESGPRGAYCGALGLWYDGRSTFSLLIRTASKAADKWIYGVGGGIVYDSNPEAELEELRIKLGALKGDSGSQK
jgi:anthranilate/para-aminobenzoate synthase component I